MKRVNLIGSVTLVSSLLFGLTLMKNPVTLEPQASDHSGSERATEATMTPVRYTFRLLQGAAKSLAYFPTMQRAIAATHPSEFKADSVLDGADVRLTGVGPVRIGMTLEEAADALGLPLIPLGSNLSGECAYYQPETQAQALGFMTVDNRVIRIDIWPGSTLATVSGATIGTSEDQLQALYPGQIEAAPNPYTQGEFLTLTPKDPEFSLYRLVFETNAEGKVVQYRTGQFPAVTWPDGCV